MALRAREHRKNKKTGITRMDAALDAMRPFGFGTRLVRQTVNELLEVYGVGVEGWPFIEETSYKLLIETMLSKQEDSTEEDKDGAQKIDVVNETTLAGMYEAGPSGLETQDTPLHTSVGLGSSSQTNDQDNASLGNLETAGLSSLVTLDTPLHTSYDLGSSSQPTDQEDNAALGNLETNVRYLALRADRGGHGQRMNKSENELKPADNVKGSNDDSVFTSVESTSDKTPMTQSSEAIDHFPLHWREGYHGWIDNGSDDDDVEYVQFPIPPLSKQIEKMMGQCEPPQGSTRRRRKSRWDEKPEGM